MIKNAFVIIASLIPFTIFGQNLVPNPSFETITSCGDTISPVITSSIVAPWISPTLGGADYFNSSCGTGCTGLGTPCNVISYQPTHTGAGYAGIIAGTGNIVNGLDNDRDYIQVQLTSPLTAGQDYCVEFYASLASNLAVDVMAINSLGAYMSSSPVTANNLTNLNFTPQIVSSTFVTDTLGWTLIQGTYTATGGEEYITIGNFLDGASTQTQAVPVPPSTGILVSYYFIDDVSVTSGACSASPPSCDSTINPFGPFCSTDLASNLSAVTSGGTWSGTGISNASAGTFDPATAGVGTHTITYALGCGSTNTLDIVVNNCSVPTASFVASSTVLCENDCIGFTNLSSGIGGSATFSWIFTGATTATSTDQNPSNICYPAIGTYAVSLTITENGNSDDTTINSYITVSSCIGVNIDFTPSDDTICQEGCITFVNNSTGSGIANYVWSFAGGTPATYIGATPPQVCFDNSGNHTVTLVAGDMNNNPLGSNDTTIVVEGCVIITPTVNFTVAQQNLCENDCVSFTDQSFGIVGTGSYNWSFPGATTTSSTSQNPSNICYPEIGIYEVTLAVTDDNGTGDTTITGIITVSECELPVPSFTISNNVICLGTCIDFTNTSTNSDSYEWIFDGGFPGGSTDENPTTICFNTIGVFDVSLIGFNTLTSDTITQTVTVYQPPVVEISDSITILEGTNTILSIETDANNYVWTPSSSLSCDECLSTLSEPDSTTEYSVLVTADNGCEVTVQVVVTVVSVEAIGIPSAFSPNGDQVNDILFIEGAGISKMNFNIYNRYGQKVFESVDQDIGWDGTFKGKEENPGIFAYTLEYVLNNGDTGVLKGNVTLVK